MKDELIISKRSAKVKNANWSGFLVLYINTYGEIRPMILDAPTEDDVKAILRLREIKNVFYIRKLSAIITEG